MDVDYTAPTMNLRYQVGVDWSLPIVKTNTPVSMAGWTFTGGVALDEGEDLASEWAFDMGDAASGVVVGSIAVGDRDPDSPGTYWYQINVDRDDGNGVEPFLRGALDAEKGTP